MSILIATKNLQRVVGDRVLFEDLNLGIESRQKIALIGPNGSGKSTLLRLLAKQDSPDQGEVIHSRGLSFSYVAQNEELPVDLSVFDYLCSQLEGQNGLSSEQAQVAASTHLSLAQFPDESQKIANLSGGWRKRLVIALAMAREPDLLLLDEPTNHMDWSGILWLEDVLRQFHGALLLVSHDRKFLDRVTSRVLEIHGVYERGYLAFDCRYSEFHSKKQEYLDSQQKLQESLSNKARRELEWLRAGVKARTTKSRSRIDEAHRLFSQLQQVNSRQQVGQRSSKMELETTGKQSKKLIAVENLCVGYGDKILLKDLQLELGAKTCIGLVGDNGSGKSSLLKVLMGELAPISGKVFRADGLKIIYFDQNRMALDLEAQVIDYLGDGSDHLVFKNQSMHVASYASRFLFQSDKLYNKIAKLSGGEKARLLLAKFFLQPADLLILDEPTNDLDIETIELLEDLIKDFPGLVLLVSHDRSFLDELCHRILALHGDQSYDFYADVEQWLQQRHHKTEVVSPAKKEKRDKPKNNKTKLNNKEREFLANVEELVLSKEERLNHHQAQLELPEVASDHLRLSQEMQAIAQLQEEIDLLYERWQELEARV